MTFYLLIFFFLMMYWWWCESPSFSVILLLLVSLFSSSIVSYFHMSKLLIMLITLIIVGGLFIIISFLIMSFPKDMDLSIMKDLKKSNKGKLWFSSLYIYLYFLFSKEMSEESLINFFWWNSELSLISSQINSFYYSMSFIFLIIILLLVLKLVDSLINVSSKKMFQS